MPNVETLNVKIEADASQLKKESNESVSVLERLKSAFANVRDRLRQPIEVNSTQYVAQIKSIENEIASLKTLVESDWGRADLGAEGVDKVKAKIEQLTNRLNDLKRKQDEVNGNWGKGSGLAKLPGQVKKIALALAGVRTITSLISKSMSTYLSQNDALKQKLNACYYAIGSMLAPVLEWIVNLFVKLVAYANAFLQALGFAGIKFQNISKSAQKTQKALAGFDEINNLNSDSGSGGSAGIGNPFADVKIDTKVLEFIKAKASEILSLLLGIVSVIGAITMGLGVIQSLGVGLAVMALSELVKDLKEFIDNPSWENFIKVLIDITALIIGIAVATKLITGPWAIALTAIMALLVFFKDDVVKWLVDMGKKIVDWFGPIWDKIKTFLDGWDESFAQWCAKVDDFVANFGDNMRNLIHQFIENVKESWNQFWSNVSATGSKWLQNISTRIKTFVDNAKSSFTNGWNYIKTFSLSTFNSLKSSMSTIFNGLWSIVKGVLNKIIGGFEKMVNGCIRGINSLTSGVRSLGNSILSLIGINFSFNPLSSVSIPRLSTGTNYVPQDMLAMIHQGEAVVPKKFNEEQFMNSEETNRLLVQLIDVVSSKEFRAYVSSSDVGRASTEFISNQSRLLGRSVL